MTTRSFFDTENKIEIAVNDGRSINLISYAFSEDIEQKLNSVIHKILGKYEKDDLAGVIYTIIKELAINGTKANIKYLFLQENGFNPDDATEYQEGLQAFKAKMSEDFLTRMGIKARDRGLWVKIYFKYNKNGLKIFIKNNMQLSLHDERRIREKLKRAMTYDDIAQFYLENMDDASEGAGMGIALIIILLKAEQIDPGFFRVYATAGETIARVEIPFSEKYVGLRKKSTSTSTV